MANYSLILNAPFKPFSYQEMVAPVLAATQAHQAIEEDYANLTAAANTVAGKANEQTDPYAYKMYKTYADDLANRADQLLRYGLNATSRRDMLNMRARYGNEIAPIDAAYKRREALADEQRKMSAQNPTMLYEREAKYMSLDDFIKNPSLDYGNQYSGALLAQQVGQAAANIAKEARDSEEGRRKLRRILPYQYELVQQHGFSREAVINAILNSPDADKILTGLVDSAITTSGVGHLDEYGNPTADGWGDLKTRRRAYDYARQGLWNAIGQTQYQMVTDEYGMKNALQAQTARIKAEADKAKDRMARSLPINTDKLVSPSADKGNETMRSTNFKGALNLLGLVPGSKTLRPQYKVLYVTSDKNKYKIEHALVRKDEAPFKIWINSSKGPRLMTRAEFIVNNKDLKHGDDSNLLGKYYDQTIIPAVHDLGYEGGTNTMYQSTLLARASNTAANNYGAHTMDAIRINIDNGDKALSSLIDMASYGDKIDISEVKGFHKDGTLDIGNRAEISDFRDDKGNLKGSTTPLFYAHPQAATDGILMKYNGKMYVIPKRYLGSIGDESYRMDVPLLEQLNAQRQALIDQYGPTAYYSSEEGQKINMAIEDAGGSYLRAIINSISATYKQPNYTITGE